MERRYQDGRDQDQLERSAQGGRALLHYPGQFSSAHIFCGIPKFNSPRPWEGPIFPSWARTCIFGSGNWRHPRYKGRPKGKTDMTGNMIDWHQALVRVTGELVRGEQRVTTHELLTEHLGIPVTDRACRR